MDIKQNSTMIIALAIAVVVVMSVMVPVISDTMDNAGSGSGGGSSETYTNTGDYYYKTLKSGDSFTIKIQDNENNVVIYKDDTVIHTLTKGGQGWTVPLYLAKWDPMVTECECLIWEVDTDGERYLYLLQDDTPFDAGDYFIIEVDGTSVHNYMYDSTDTLKDDYTDTLYAIIYDNNGDLVYADSPMVTENTLIVAVDYDFYSKQTEIEYNGSAYGTYASYYTFHFQLGLEYDLWRQIEGTPNNSFDGVLIWDDNGEEKYIDGDSIEFTMDISESDKGFKVNGITLTGHYERDGYTATATQTITKMIVPKTVKTDVEKQAGWLTEDTPSEQLDISCREVEPGKIGVFYNYWDVSEPQPFYIQDMRENPILVLAIGETWAMYIDTVPSDVDDPYGDDEAGKIRNGLGYFFTYTISVNTNGTISYKNNAEIEGQRYTKDDLIAYISPNGSLKPYYNENAPKSPTLYSYLAYMETSDDAVISLNVIASNGYNSPTVEGFGYTYGDGFDYDYNISMNYTTEGGYVTGMNVTATAPSVSAKEFSFPFTGQTPPEPYDIGWEGDVYSVAFSVVESGAEETSGGGSGGLSPTLIAVLSIIPIMVLVGLVLMAVRSMKV